MEFQNIEFEHSLILIINHQKVKITPFVTNELGNIKMGIEAPFGVAVNREEIHKLKQKRHPSAPVAPTDFSKKIQALFTALLLVTNPSEQLEVAAKQLFDKVKTLSLLTLEQIARGERATSKWIITCALDVLIQAQSNVVQSLFSSDELFIFFARPLLNRKFSHQELLKSVSYMEMPLLIEQITDYSSSKEPNFKTVDFVQEVFI